MSFQIRGKLCVYFDTRSDNVQRKWPHYSYINIRITFVLRLRMRLTSVKEALIFILDYMYCWSCVINTLLIPRPFNYKPILFSSRLAVYEIHVTCLRICLHIQLGIHVTRGSEPQV
jgi:hypothetical protein